MQVADTLRREIAELDDQISREESGRFEVHRPKAMPEGKSFRWGARNPAWESARNLLSGLGRSKRGLSVADGEEQDNPLSRHSSKKSARRLGTGTSAGR